MSVVDASVVVEYLADGPDASVAAVRLHSEPFALLAPHLIDAEVGHALRRHVAAGELSARAAGRALQEFRDLPLHRQGHEVLLDAAWALRSNLSFYDALYVALAALAEQPLITFDARLAKTPRLPAAVELLAA
jgi:predicted nucleic acid-binding protein